MRMNLGVANSSQWLAESRGCHVGPVGYDIVWLMSSLSLFHLIKYVFTHFKI